MIETLEKPQEDLEMLTDEPSEPSSWFDLTLKILAIVLLCGFPIVMLWAKFIRKP